MGHLGALDLSFTQFGTLLYLETEGEASLTAVAAILSRSLPATSRMVDGLVQRRYVVREEDTSDRRVKRLRLSDEGRRFLAALEQGRVEAQLAVMDFLSESEYADVARAMDLLAHAAARRTRHEQHSHDSATVEPESTGERT
jgi:DNA-binding MarR family transcriptional regulator